MTSKVPTGEAHIFHDKVTTTEHTSSGITTLLFPTYLSMRCVAWLTGFLACCASLALADAVNTRTVTVWAWPFSSPSPQELAKISFDAQAMTTTVLEYKQPRFSESIDSAIRVGLYDVETTQWRGVLTAAASFDTALQQQIILLLDGSGDVYHLAFGGAARPAKSTNAKTSGGVFADSGPLKVTLERPTPGPRVQLNKPVKISKEGKVDEKEPEKGFLQKYVDI